MKSVSTSRVETGRGSGSARETLERKIRDRTAVVAPVGLGYVGLPIALEVAKAGYTVKGVENNPVRCQRINRGENYIQDIRGENHRRFGELVAAGKISAARDFSPLKSADIVLICVPTPITRNKEPDLSHIHNVLQGLKANFGPGKLVILESTTFPGNTEEMFLPALQSLGLRVGEDFFLAFSPERIDPGNRNFHTANTAKIIGGVTANCTELGKLFYSQIITNIVGVSSPRVAEMTKLFENVYRSVNIALVNELTLLCERMSIDVFEVISAAATKPYGFQAFWPGPGVGGHCIPLDPYYLAWKGKEYDLHARFIELAGEINESMPRFVAGKVARILNRQGKALRGSKILQLGITYKKDVDDYRESPAVEIYELLTRAGAEVQVADPYVPEFFIREHSPVYDRSGPPVKTVAVDGAGIRRADLVLLVTDHTDFPYEFIAQGARAVFDTRNAFGTRGLKGAHIFHLSSPVDTVGEEEK